MKAAMLDTTVGQLVIDAPGRSRVFERYGIDYCCGGRLTLGQALAERGIDASTIVADLENIGEGDVDSVDPRALTMTELADHIEETHHVYLRSELPRLRELAAKVTDKHGASYPWLSEVQSTFNDLQSELEAHMEKEERILFPMIRGMERRGGSDEFMVESPISVMEHEHDDAADALRQLRGLTNGFTPPDGACNSFRALLDRLHTLEQDLHRHIHKENNILFVRALEAQNRLQ